MPNVTHSFAIAGKKDGTKDGKSGTSQEEDLEAIMNETKPAKGDGGEQSEGVQATGGELYI